MMLKVNGAYLDFNGDIEIEKKIKLFEDIETSDGDVSFAFELELTSHNIKTLKIPFPDVSSKRVYNIQDTEVFNDEGLRINKGSIRVESISGRYASCSFFGGNSNWFAAISGNLNQLDLSRYDRDLTYDEIIDSWNDTNGIVYPIIDTGVLITRGQSYLVEEDFVGCMFVHTLMKEIFKNSGIKINGDLINDPFYKSLVIVSNNRSQDIVNNRKSYIEKNVPQTPPNDPPGPSAVMAWQNDSIPPYFDGSSNNFNIGTGRYVADVKMSVKFNINVVYSFFSGADTAFIFLRKNGVVQKTFTIESPAPLSQITFSDSSILDLNSGDYVDYGVSQDSLSNAEILSATLSIEPVFIYRSFAVSTVPLWTKQQFVSNIFRLFNCISSYDPISKILTINYFDKIKTKSPIDISEHIEVNEQDYSSFIGNYGQNNLFNYQEGSDEELQKYNISDFVKYGSGLILADNDFIEQSAEVVESDFTSPISYRNISINGSLERINFVEYEEEDQLDFSSVSNNSGIPQFDITDADDFFSVGDVVRIVSYGEVYDGDFIVTSVTSSYVEIDSISYVSTATGSVTKLSHKLTTDDNVYIMSVIKKTSVGDVLGDSLKVDGVSQSDVVTAYFNILGLGKFFESKYKQGLSFGSINSPYQFQKSLIDSYWTQFDRIVNDPVMIKATGHLPWNVYNSLDFLSPVTLRTLETSNRYYINRITGYRNSYTPCEIELIKLP